MAEEKNLELEVVESSDGEVTFKVVEEDKVDKATKEEEKKLSKFLKKTESEFVENQFSDVIEFHVIWILQDGAGLLWILEDCT